MGDVNKVNADRTLVSAGGMGNASVNTQIMASIGVVAIDDVFFVKRIPKGSVITEVKVNAEAGLSDATGTLDVGYVMGEVLAPTYFDTGVNSVAGAQSVSASMPLECTDDCYITVSAKTAATVADKILAVTTQYEFKGEV